MIQSMDRLTLIAGQGASINDPSGGTPSTVTIDDSRDVVIDGFTINGGTDGIDCQDGSVCRVNGNTIQGAVNGYGVGVFFSQLFLDGGTLQNNGTGLAAINGATAKATNVTIQNNSGGIEIRTQSFVKRDAQLPWMPDYWERRHRGDTTKRLECEVVQHVCSYWEYWRRNPSH